MSPRRRREWPTPETGGRRRRRERGPPDGDPGPRANPPTQTARGPGLECARPDGAAPAVVERGSSAPPATGAVIAQVIDTEKKRERNRTEPIPKKKKRETQFLAVDHSARAPMKNAASCENQCELQNAVIIGISNAHGGPGPPRSGPRPPEGRARREIARQKSPCATAPVRRAARPGRAPAGRRGRARSPKERHRGVSVSPPATDRRAVRPAAGPAAAPHRGAGRLRARAPPDPERRRRQTGQKARGRKSPWRGEGSPEPEPHQRQPASADEESPSEPPGRGNAVGRERGAGATGARTPRAARPARRGSASRARDADGKSYACERETPRFSTHRPQVGREDPLDLSISLSGGEETNQDSPSSGERSGKSPAPNPRAPLGGPAGTVA